MSVELGLNDVAAAGPGDVWGVGNQAAHLKNGSWKVEEAPDGIRFTQLAVANGHHWALGQDASFNHVIVHRGQSGWTVTRQFDESVWLAGIDVTRAGVVWVVGTKYSSDFLSSRPLILKGQRGAWRSIPIARVGSATAVDAARGQVWVLGTNWRYRAISIHWDGTKWIRGQIFDPEWYDLNFGLWPQPTAVAIGRRGPLWTVSAGDTGDCCHYEVIVAQRERNAWGEPFLGPYWGSPSDIAIDDAGRTATVVGSNFAGDGGGGIDVGFLYSWDGASWHMQYAEGVTNPDRRDWNYSAIDADSSGARWAVGRTPSGDPLVVYQCRPTRAGR